MIPSYRPVASTQYKLHDRILYDPKFFLESLVEIVNKDKETIPFILNPSQIRYYLNRTSRDIILKPRQLGFSTEIMGLFLHDTMFCPNTLSVIVAHTDKDASDLFERAHFMFDSIPEIFRPSVSRSNVRELKFDKVNSKFTIGSAEAKHFGICVHPQVKVLTKNGFPKKISEVGIPTIQWDGDLISITPWTSPEPIVVTPNHLILTQDGWKEASKLASTDTVAQPIRKITEKLKTVKITIPFYKRNWVLKKVDIEEMRKLRKEGVSVKELSKIFNLHIQTVYKYLKKYLSKPEVEVTYSEVGIPLTEEFGWIIGMMLSEGYIKYNVIFSLNNSESEYAKRIERFFRKYPFQSNIGRRKSTENFIRIFNKTKTCINVTICNIVWARFFKEEFYTSELVRSKGRLGRNCKYIPDWVFDAPKEFCDGLVHGLVDGDGNKNDEVERVSYASYRPQLLYQFRDLIASLYGWTSIGAKCCNIRGITYDKWTGRLFGNEVVSKKQIVVKDFYAKRKDKTVRVNGYTRYFQQFLKTIHYPKKQYYHSDGKFVYQKIRKIEPFHYKGQLYDMVDQPNHCYRTISGVIHNSKTINNLHITEVSHPYYKEDFLIGLLESVPRSGRIVLESTARGEGNIFHRYYLGAKNKENEFRTHYYRWFEHEEYKILPLPGERIILTEEEEDLVNKYPKYFTHLNRLAKIKWRREKKSRLGKLFIQEYPEDDDDDSFIKSGSPVLDVEILKAIDKQLAAQSPQEIWLGGELYIYKIAEQGAKYIVGCDPSEGDINSDFSAAVVLRSFPPPIEQVALLHGRWTPDTFSEKIYKVGMAYNNAILLVERNNHGHAVLLNLTNGIVRNGIVKYPTYPNIYAGPDRKLGWLTGINKVPMITELSQAIRTGQIVIVSKKFIEEAKKYSYLGGGKMGAPSGSHDDIVMAQALALMGILTGQFSVEFV